LREEHSQHCDRGGRGHCAVHAQQPKRPPNALQGFSQNRDKPIKINSAALEGA